MSNDSGDQRRGAGSGDGNGTDARKEREDKKRKEEETVPGLMPRSPARTRATVTITPKIEPLFLFLESLWNDPIPETGWPERVVLATLRNGGQTIASQIREIPFNYKTRPGREAMAELSNMICGLAQSETDATSRPQVFGLLAYDHARSDHYYAKFTFRLRPSGMNTAAWDERGVEDDDDNTSNAVKDDLLKELYRDRRFSQEWVGRMFQDYRDSMHELVGRYESRLSASESVNKELLATHLRLIELKEALADKKAAREISERKLLFWQEKVERLVDGGMALLPGVVSHLTSGKSGIVEGLKAFSVGLDDDQQRQLLGDWQEDGQRMGDAILTVEQAIAFRNIVEGPAATVDQVGEFIASISSNQEQLAAVQAVLRPGQLAQIGQIVSSLQKLIGSANGAAS